MTDAKWYEVEAGGTGIFAQGDVCFVVCDAADVPADARLVPLEFDGHLVVAHSETGHHHAFPDGSHVVMHTTSNPQICYLRCETTAELLHHRAWDTHAPVEFGGGRVYVVHRQMEPRPDGWQIVED